MKLRLWDALADIALKQHDKESAALTMEVAVSFDRDNLARQERLAKMYFDMGPSAADKAIAQHQYLLSRKKPDRLESYKALAALFFQGGAHDKMWCVAGAMTCLGKADPPLRALFENFRPIADAQPARASSTRSCGARSSTPTRTPYLSALFALLSPAIAMTTAQPHKVMGLDQACARGLGRQRVVVRRGPALRGQYHRVDGARRVHQEGRARARSAWST